MTSGLRGYSPGGSTTTSLPIPTANTREFQVRLSQPTHRVLAMGRQTSSARSIVDPLKGDRKQPLSGLRRVISLFATAFAVYQLPLDKVKPEVFENLRQNCWRVNDDDYERAFGADVEGEAQGGDGRRLHAIGEMGFSGSVGQALGSLHQRHGHRLITLLSDLLFHL